MAKITVTGCVLAWLMMISTTKLWMWLFQMFLGFAGVSVDMSFPFLLFSLICAVGIIEAAKDMVRK